MILFQSIFLCRNYMTLSQNVSLVIHRMYLSFITVFPITVLRILSKHVLIKSFQRILSCLRNSIAFTFLDEEVLAVSCVIIFHQWSHITNEDDTSGYSMIFRCSTSVEQLYGIQREGFGKLQVLSAVLCGERERFFYHLTMTHIKCVASQLEKS